MDNQQNTTQQAPISQNSNLGQPQKSKKKKVALFSFLVALVLAAFGGLYYWQNSINQDLQSQLDASKAEIIKIQQSSPEVVSEMPKNTPTEAPTTDEQVLAAVKAYCNAAVDPATKQALVLKVGTAGENQRKVLYSSDKNFAYVNAVCSKDGTTEGSGSAYYLKKVNDTWIVLYRGQMTSPQMTTQFNIPSEFN